MIKYGSASQQTVLRTGSPLSNYQIATVAPGVFAQEEHHSRSDRYGFVPTVEIINDLRAEGFEVMEVRQSRTRIKDKRDFTKHMVRMQHRSVMNTLGSSPEILLLNSHDGSSAYDMMSGVFRGVCQNGLIAGDLYERVKVMHRSNIKGMVIDGCTRILEDTKQITHTINEWSGQLMTFDERATFAKAAAALRWESNAPVAPSTLLQARRFDDAKANLWTVFNTVQENLIRGGQLGRASSGRRLRTREVTGIDQTVDINRQLWNLAEEFNTAKTNRETDAFIDRFEHAFA